MTAKVVLGSTTRAQDLGYLALNDVVTITTSLEVDYRLVGGHMVALLIAAYNVTDTPDRETVDADLGAHFEVIADPRLPAALRALHYTSVAGNRFVRKPEQDSTTSWSLTFLFRQLRAGTNRTRWPAN